MSESLERLASLLEGRQALILSGAGVSTESGIPDYRSPDRLSRPRRPMLYQTFVSSEAARRRYWARSLIGWRNVDQARPNPGHRALARLEHSGIVPGLITQNVDGLHQQAGSLDVIELHGSLASVLCLCCRAVSPRRDLQQRLRELNPEAAKASVEVAPDGDADLADGLIDTFAVPECEGCGGVLKPHVVFFGENVPRQRVTRSMKLLDGSDVLLVVGSSLSVMSGMRFVLAAHRSGKPVAVVNRGPTRADALADLKVEGRLGEVLPRLVSLTSAGQTMPRSVTAGQDAETVPGSGAEEES
jgi:NAD-dependent deacetylase sirtuin 4